MSARLPSFESFKPKFVTFDRAGRQMKPLWNVVGIQARWIEWWSPK
jgi:hypothetical protein